MMDLLSRALWEFLSFFVSVYLSKMYWLLSQTRTAALNCEFSGRTGYSHDQKIAQMAILFHFKFRIVGLQSNPSVLKVWRDSQTIIIGLYKVSGQQTCPLYIIISDFLWYEVGRQHVKALQAAAISPYWPHPPAEDSHNTGNFMPYSFRIVCGFFNVTR